MRFEDFADNVKHLVFVPDYALFQLLGRKQAARNLVHRWCKEGKLIRPKRGLYILGERYKKQPPYFNFQLANILVSPSYISLDTALSHYGLIPERVVEITSVSLKRPKVLSNPLGSFSYRKLCKTAYPHGVVSEGEENSFLIANKEKTLLDKIYFCHSARYFRMSYLFDSLRMEEPDLRTLDFDLLKEYAKAYGTKKMVSVASVIRRHYGV